MKKRLHSLFHFLYVGVICCISLSVFASSDEDLTFLMSLSLEQLGDVEIESASFRSEKQSEAPATAIVITEQQIKDRGYEFFEDLLRDIPGFDLVQVNGTYRSVFSQRGTFSGENNRSLILIDGIVESNMLEGSLLHGGQYSLHNVKKVEIIYGPASALYGANAFGGIISITTNHDSQEDYIDYHYGQGTFSSRYHKLQINKKISDVKVHISAHTYDTDGVTFENRGENYSNSYVHNAYSLEARVSTNAWLWGYSRYNRPSGLGTFSNVSGFEQTGTEPPGPGLLQSDFNNEKPSLWHMVSETAFVKYKQKISDRLTFSSKLFTRKSSIALDSYSYNYIPSTAQLERNSFGHESDTTGAEIRLDYTPNGDWDFVGGVQWERSDIERGYRTKFADGTDITSDGVRFNRISQVSREDRISDVYKNIALFGQFRKHLKFSIPTRLLLGARYDYNNQYGRDFNYGETFNPRLGLVSELSPSTTMKFLYGTAYRAPTSFDRFTTTEVRRANPDLSPERLTTVEMGVNHRWSDNIYIEANIYRNNISNTIISNVDTGIPIPNNTAVNFSENQNAGEGHSTGAEFRLNAVFNNFDMFMNGTLQRASQDDQHGTINEWPNIAKFKANGGVTWRYNQDVSLYIVQNWVGKRSTSLTSPLTEVDAYTVTNMNVAFSNLYFGHMNLSLRVNNVFNTHWQDPGIRSADGGFYDLTHPQPGRTYSVEISVRF
ncbi:MAG: outer membrane receptor for ferrienterochelin and colicins [Flavobacteriales bacterium]|jgi:outer membrane receptor protein involved in Fe transport